MTARVAESRQDSSRNFDGCRSVKDPRERARILEGVRLSSGCDFDYLVAVTGRSSDGGDCRPRESVRPLRSIYSEGTEGRYWRRSTWNRDACEIHSKDGLPLPFPSHRNENLCVVDRQRASGTH